MLSARETDQLLAAAEQSMFAEFWRALIGACRTTRLAPARLLGPMGTFRFREPARTAVKRLWAVDCPFDLEKSHWGPETMLGAFRRLAGRAELCGAETIGFDSLYG